MRTCLIGVVAAGILLSARVPVWGQFNRSGGITGSSMKSSSTGSFGSRSSRQGTTGNLGGSGNSQSFLGNGTAGSARASMGGTSSDQMLRSARGARNFVGADVQDSRNFLGYADSSQGSSSNLGSGLGRSSYGYGRTGQSNLYGSSSYRSMSGYGGTRYGQYGYGRRTTSVRPSLDLGFDYAGPATEELAPKFSARVAKFSSVRFHTPLQVSMENGTAVLRGAVASEHERALVEQLALLEPGVRRVDNQLTVAGSSAEPPAPATKP